MRSASPGGPPGQHPLTSPQTAVGLGERRLRICHPVWRLGRGGLERHLLALISAMPPDRAQHLLIVRGAVPGDLETLSLPQSDVGLVADQTSGRDPWWPFRLAGIFRGREVDLIHVRGLTLLPDVVLAARLAGNIPVAFSFHGFEAGRETFGFARRRLYRWAIGRCRARWAVSRPAADGLASALGLPGDAWDVLPNGVDVGRFRPSDDRTNARAALGISPKTTVLLCVANLKPIKGHPLLLDAMEKMDDRVGQCRLLLVGKDYMNGELHRHVSSRPRLSRVEFVGEQDDVLAWYHAADLFILPSRFEGMSNALLEAMACGLPVVATAVGGNAEVIQHGVSGLLSPPGDADALARAIGFLASDAPFRARLGAAARRTVCEKFALDEAAEAYLQRYARVAGGESQ